MVSCVGAVRETKTIKATTHSVGSASLLRQYRSAVEMESIESRLGKLEEKCGYYVQSVLRSRLKSEDIELMTTLSEASLRNIVTIQRLVKQIQDASEEN